MAGVTDAELAKVVAHVGLNQLSNNAFNDGARGRGETRRGAPPGRAFRGEAGALAEPSDRSHD